MDWQLKGQGAANLVFGYSGDDPNLRGHVLRVRKVVAHTVSETDQMIWAGVIDMTHGDTKRHDMSYIRDLMAVLLGRQYVFPGELLPLPASLQPLMQECGGVEAPEALLLPDHTTFQAHDLDGFTAEGPAVCLEIKPKWGLRPGAASSKDLLPCRATAATATTTTAAAAADGDDAPDPAATTGRVDSDRTAAAGVAAAATSTTTTTTTSTSTTTTTTLTATTITATALSSVLVGRAISGCAAIAAATTDRVTAAGTSDVGCAAAVAATAAVASSAAGSSAGGSSGATGDAFCSEPRHRYPRYMLHMLLKHVKDGLPWSRYNPLDLFSGELHRMRRALWCLLESPSNNLRIFVDGEPVYGAGTAVAAAAAAAVAATSAAAGAATAALQTQGSDPGAVAAAAATSAAAAAVTTELQVESAQLQRLAGQLTGFVVSAAAADVDGAPTGAPAGAPAPAAEVPVEHLKAAAAEVEVVVEGGTAPRGCSASGLGASVVQGKAVAVVAAAEAQAPAAVGGGCASATLDVLVELTAAALQREGLLPRLHAAQALDDLGPERARELHDQLLEALRSGELVPPSVAAARNRATQPPPGDATAPTAPPPPLAAGSDLESPSASPPAAAGQPAGAAAGGRGAPDSGPRGCWPCRLAALRRYMISATAKDCGIMVTLQRAVPAGPQPSHGSASAQPSHGSVMVSHGSLAAQHRSAAVSSSGSAGGPGEVSRPWAGVLKHAGTGRWYLYKVAVVDLDLKAASKIPRHLDLDRKLAACARKHEALLVELAARSGWQAA